MFHRGDWIRVKSGLYDSQKWDRSMLSYEGKVGRIYSIYREMDRRSLTPINVRFYTANEPIGLYVMSFDEDEIELFEAPNVSEG